ncbi:MAG: iron-sulfur cluster-binding protein [Planctomycetota bacterium]|jgi:dihydroorotate dehydrogenase electron transfer subunit
MPAPPSDARSQLATVAAVEPCGDDGILFRVVPDEPIDAIRASRFFMLRREDGLSPGIPRPYSIYRQSGDELEFLIKVMGPGSQALAGSRQGDRVRLIGPLGNGWPTLDGDGAPWVMLAGGVGSAPFLMAIEQALRGMDGATPCRPDQIWFLFGAATQGLLYDLDRFRALGVEVRTATMDGSDGQRGHVLDLLDGLQAEGALPEQVRLLACGPERMLEAVEDRARERGLDAWLSLETMMGCGVGICNGCPVPTVPDGPLGSWSNAKCCVEGPVFPVSAVTLHGI